MNKIKVTSIVVTLLFAVLMASAGILRTNAATPEEIANTIDKGIEWLAEQQYPDGSWGDSYRVGQTGLAVLKFETHAMQMGKDPLDPSYEYYNNVSNGLNYLFSKVYNISISVQPAGDPDTNGNGIGVYIYDSEWDRMYETGIAAMAIAHSRHPEKVVNVPGSDVDGRTYEDVLTDVVDYIAYGQSDPDTGDYRGGWRYWENFGDSDNSVSGYAVLGLVYAESPPPIGFGLTIPAWVKTELNYWIDYIQTNVTGTTDDGGSGYTDPGSWVNILKTGNLLQEMAFVGDSLSTPRVQDAIDYIERHWDDLNTDPGWNGTEYAHKQAMFTTMKGFTAFAITTITVEREGVPTTVDWYDEMATVLVAQQEDDGSWPLDNYMAYQPITTTWALLVLEKAAPPVAKYDLTVHVTEAVTGNPISGAKVDVVGPESRMGYTNGTGHVKFLDLLTGGYTATASALYYRTESVAFTLDQDKLIHIELTPIVIESCDSIGTKKNSFIPSETVYVNGTGFAPSTTYNMYVVSDVTWTDGMPIPARIPGTETSVASDPSGNIPPTIAWQSPLTIGKYDIVVDINGNGNYDAGVDALDDNDIVSTAGFLIIFEYWLGTILGLAGCFAAFGAFCMTKRKRL